MKKYKVTLLLMVNPSVNDDTFPRTYNVEAETELQAYHKASKMQGDDEPHIKHRSIFDYKVVEIK